MASGFCCAINRLLKLIFSRSINLKKNQIHANTNTVAPSINALTAMVTFDSDTKALDRMMVSSRAKGPLRNLCVSIDVDGLYLSNTLLNAQVINIENNAYPKRRLLK